MCGICGEINFNNGVSGEPIQRMSRVLNHRGHDDEGMVLIKGDQYFEINNSHGMSSCIDGFEVGLGHRRLSIIDLSTAAHQPMCNEDKSIWIVFNGEIYNFKEVKERLAER